MKLRSDLTVRFNQDAVRNHIRFGMARMQLEYMDYYFENDVDYELGRLIVSPRDERPIVATASSVNFMWTEHHRLAFIALWVESEYLMAIFDLGDAMQQTLLGVWDHPHVDKDEIRQPDLLQRLGYEIP